ncbi:SVM family protein [Candidatus Phytoplasma aurantifolia]|nr:SVM family protein [Candidatus Phytoplasma aurantifolia]MDO8079075.1 SVM family protein [Candidatus Phytoplasma aurantifolia]
MIKIKNNLLFLLNIFFVFAFLGLFLMNNNHKVMAMENNYKNKSKKDIAI